MILGKVKCRGRTKGDLYYYQGNFYFPFLSIRPDEIGKVRRLIRAFKKENKKLVDIDRRHPKYKNLSQLAKEQL